MPLPLWAALAPTVIGGISSLLGLGKGKEVPKESKQTSKARQQMMNYLMPGGQPRQMTPFTGTMPGVQKGFYDALNMMSKYYGGKSYQMPKRQGMGQILGLPTTGGGFNPYASSAASTSTNPYAAGLGGGMGGGINPWAINRLPQVALQEGGVVTQPTSAILGEAGPEAVIPLEPTQQGVRQYPMLGRPQRPRFGMATSPWSGFGKRRMPTTPMDFSRNAGAAGLQPASRQPLGFGAGMRGTAYNPWQTRGAQRPISSTPANWATPTLQRYNELAPGQVVRPPTPMEGEGYGVNVATGRPFPNKAAYDQAMAIRARFPGREW